MLSKLWIDEHGGRKYLRVDFSDDTHIAIEIRAPFGHIEVKHAFQLAAFELRGIAKEPPK